MNRLEKKCLVTATSAHGLLVLILFVGPAFFLASEKTNSPKPITVFDPNTVSKLLTDGGTPQNVRAVPLPLPPAEQKVIEPAPQPPEIPKPVKPQVKDLETPKPDIKIKPVAHGDEPVIKPKKHVVEINPNELMPNNKNTADKARAEKLAAAERRARAQAAADAKRRADQLKAFGNALKSLKNNLSGTTMVSLPVGAGGGGPASVNYFQLVQSTLDNAWHPSQTLGDDTPKATISITISRDGALRGHLTKRSGNSSMDRSVQNVLDTVTSVEPFPESFKEQQITASFTFDIQAKRQ